MVPSLNRIFRATLPEAAARYRVFGTLQGLFIIYAHTDWAHHKGVSLRVQMGLVKIL